MSLTMPFTMSFKNKVLIRFNFPHQIIGNFLKPDSQSGNSNLQFQVQKATSKAFLKRTNPNPIQLASPKSKRLKTDSKEESKKESLSSEEEYDSYGDEDEDSELLEDLDEDYESTLSSDANFIKLKQQVEKLEPFEKSWRSLKMTKNPLYQGLSKRLKKRMRNFYYLKQGKIPPKPSRSKKSSKLSLEKLNSADYQLFINVLKDGDLEEAHQAVFAKCLTDNLPKGFSEYYANKIIDKHTKNLNNFKGIDDIVNALRDIPEYLRLKGTARSFIKMKAKLNLKDQSFIISSYNNLIKPSLKYLTKSSYSEYNYDEVKIIKLISDQNLMQQISDDDALKYLNLIESQGLFNLDFYKQKFFLKTDQFWTKILIDMLGVNKDIVAVWIANKEYLMTSAMLRHYKKNSTSIEFSNICSLFQQMTEKNLNELYFLMQYPNFNELIALLNKDDKVDFNSFKAQSEGYIKLDKPQQINAFKSLLKDTSLDDWQQYQDQIISSEQFAESDKALKVINDKIRQLSNSLHLDPLKPDQMEAINVFWNKAFDQISVTSKYQEMEWQKALVCFLVHLIVYQGKTNVIISLGTGHGKTIIIALLAEMLHLMAQEVNVVCLNNFLANWGRDKFGSAAVQNELIEYLSLEQLLKRDPSADKIIIYDEIDQMITGDSLEFIETKTDTMIINKPSQMKQWKGLIGFSGTISQSTMSQLKAELGETILIDVPSLRKDKNQNKIVKVMKTPIAQRHSKIIKRMQELKDYVHSFIIIFKTDSDISKFTATKEYKTFKEDRKVYKVTNFSENFAEIEKTLSSISKSNFIVLTNEDGARGVDYKGLSPAHVIITFEPNSYSQAVQALGRGSRTLNKICEGTIICESPITTDEGQYLRLLQSRDQEKTRAMIINCQIARILHKKKFKKQKDPKAEDQNIKQLTKEEDPAHLTLLIFKTVMERGENLQKINGGLTLWEYLKRLDEDELMPKDPWQEWKQLKQ